jgi:hypothetical protein
MDGPERAGTSDRHYPATNQILMPEGGIPERNLCASHLPKKAKFATFPASAEKDVSFNTAGRIYAGKDPSQVPHATLSLFLFSPSHRCRIDVRSQPLRCTWPLFCSSSVASGASRAPIEWPLDSRGTSYNRPSFSVRRVGY